MPVMSESLIAERVFLDALEAMMRAAEKWSEVAKVDVALFRKDGGQFSRQYFAEGVATRQPVDDARVVARPGCYRTDWEDCDDPLCAERCRYAVSPLNVSRPTFTVFEAGGPLFCITFDGCPTAYLWSFESERAAKNLAGELNRIVAPLMGGAPKMEHPRDGDPQHPFELAVIRRACEQLGNTSEEANPGSHVARLALSKFLGESE